MTHTSVFALVPGMIVVLLAGGAAPVRDRPLELTGDESPERAICIYCPQDASFAEALAAREVRRYIYLRTGHLLPIRPVTKLPDGEDAIVVARQDRPIHRAVFSGYRSVLPPLRAQAFYLTTIARAGRRVVVIAGGDDAGTLYGAYRFAEHLGVRFYLHGDVIPDDRIALKLPDLDEVGRPLFGLRGIQPFHDFPEGPDWWDLDDYKAIISQLPKLGMNFIGLHTYPEDRPAAEPTVWIGLARDIGADGRVNFSYPSIYYNTALPVGWGFAAKKTSDYVFGAGNLFASDAHSSQIMAGVAPRPDRAEHCNEVFNRAGAMLREAFRHAHALGVKTCVGTETPLVVPKRVAARLKKLGKDPKAPAVLQELYDGMFRRIAKAYPIDYYWFWTPEGWTWQGAKPEQIEATIKDIKTAYAAAKNCNAPFQLGTCGWVLGPPSNRALFDEVLPKDMFTSCISRQVGHAPIESGFARVSGRGKWAIPWLEDDPAMTSPQLWVGRMRTDAADALRYGCTGLMGIHWRTRILAPNVSALARAAWDQTGWGERARTAGPVGGKIATFPDRDFANTRDDTLYQTVRYDVNAYRLAVPNGVYFVMLRFCEPAYNEKGKRVFGVRLQGRRVIDKLDIFATVGQNRALDYPFVGVEVANGWLDIEFERHAELPCIAAIDIEGVGFVQKINCGGPAYKDYDPDPPVLSRYPPTDDFYLDWATHLFGAAAAADVAKVFAKMDCELPRPSDWVNGPGGLKPDSQSWETVGKAYAFVDELAALRPRVKGAGNRARFDYWLDSFRYLRASGRVRCTWARYNAAIKKVQAEKDPKAQRDLATQTALPIRKQLVQDVREVYRHLLATVNTTGTMGTVANWEQHILPGLLIKPGDELSKILGKPLPPDAQPDQRYDGPTRVIVSTVRSSVTAGESLTLKVIVLSQQPPSHAALYWRTVDDKGTGEFAKIPLTHVARGVYSVTFPPDGAKGMMLEYYVKVMTGDGKAVCFPATAPDLNQTVVVVP